jgi:hypothetical protein
MTTTAKMTTGILILVLPKMCQYRAKDGGLHKHDNARIGELGDEEAQREVVPDLGSKQLDMFAEAARCPFVRQRGYRYSSAAGTYTKRYQS